MFQIQSNGGDFVSLRMALLTAVAFLSCGRSAPQGFADGIPTAVPIFARAEAIFANDRAKYSWIRDNVISVKCMDCHSANEGDGDGLDHANFDTYEGTLAVVKPGDPEHSKLFIAVKSKKMPKGMDPMPGMPNPPAPVPLNDEQLQAISDWISAGAPNN